MKKLIALLVIVSLSGCATTDPFKMPKPAEISSPTAIVIDGQTIGKAPPPKIPDLPPSLSQKAGPLPAITDRSLSGLVKDGASTDTMYNDVAHQLNNVIDVYACVKDSLNNEKDATACFKDK